MLDTFANLGLQDSQLHQSTNFDNANNSNSCQQHTVATPRSAAVQQLVDQHNAKTNQKFGNGHATTNPNISHTVFSDNGGVSKAGTKTDQAVAATRCNTPSVSSMSTIDSTDSSTSSVTTPSQGGGEPTLVKQLVVLKNLLNLVMQHMQHTGNKPTGNHFVVTQVMIRAYLPVGLPQVCMEAIHH